jgi:hypothetical protein
MEKWRGGTSKHLRRPAIIRFHNEQASKKRVVGTLETPTTSSGCKLVYYFPSRLDVRDEAKEKEDKKRMEGMAIQWH